MTECKKDSIEIWERILTNTNHITEVLTIIEVQNKLIDLLEKKVAKLEESKL